MAELYILKHEFDGESRTYPVYLRKPPNPGEITHEFLMNLAEQLGVEYDHSYHRLSLHGSYKPDDIPYVDVDVEGKLEKPAIAEFAVLSPTYYGKHDPLPEGKQEWDEPHVPVLVRECDGLRIVLGSHDYHADVPDIQIERQPSGWAIFIHPQPGGDPAGYVYILDDETCYFHPERLSPVKILNDDEPIPEELYALPTESNRIRFSYEDEACPDCEEKIPLDVVDGQACSNCGHVFHPPSNDDEA
jgi:hypothetical protein